MSEKSSQEPQTGEGSTLRLVAPVPYRQVYRHVADAAFSIQRALEGVQDPNGELFDQLVGVMELLAVVRGRVAEQAFMTGELQWVDPPSPPIPN